MQIDGAQQLIFNQNGGFTSGVPVLWDLNVGGILKFEIVCAISVGQKIGRNMDFSSKDGQFYLISKLEPKDQS